MFTEQCRHAIEAAPRTGLPAIAAAIWKAYAAGVVSEEDAQALAEAIEARKVIPAPAAAAAARRSVGSRPRSPASTERRRRWVSSGWLPPQLAVRFTLAEAAVLAVIAAEVARHGRCTLTLGHIAALAGVCRTTVRNAMRVARLAGLITVEEWRLSAWRSAPNTVKIVSVEWSTWLRLRGRGQGGAALQRGGVKSVSPTNTPLHKSDRSSSERSWSGGDGTAKSRPRS